MLSKLSVIVAAVLLTLATAMPAPQVAVTTMRFDFEVEVGGLATITVEEAVTVTAGVPLGIETVYVTLGI
ncbi:hypothetical protein C8R45DRAFT_1103493 [Mycena sanguinolenta]|nr:hypothetical protein C8R45DRAFT_1103493 [Mycena sanguinolenta]